MSSQTLSVCHDTVRPFIPPQRVITSAWFLLQIFLTFLPKAGTISKDPDRHLDTPQPRNDIVEK